MDPAATTQNNGEVATEEVAVQYLNFDELRPIENNEEEWKALE